MAVAPAEKCEWESDCACRTDGVDACEEDRAAVAAAKLGSAEFDRAIDSPAASGEVMDDATEDGNVVEEVDDDDGTEVSGDGCETLNEGGK